MKIPILWLFLAAFLFIPQYSFAATLEESYRSAMLELVKALKDQVRLLEAELKIQNGRVLGATRPALLPSAFYSGEYESLYSASGGDLVHIGGSGKSRDHEEVWKLFRLIAGADAGSVSEYRVYKDDDAEFDAFVDLIGGGGTWVLGVNFSELDMTRGKEREALTDLLIHEYAHMLLHSHPDIAKAFSNRFWDSAADTAYLSRLESAADSRREALIDAHYENNREDYVSEYAAMSPDEDFAESFVAFIRSENTGRSGAQLEKMNFFSAYPAFTAIKDRLTVAL